MFTNFQKQKMMEGLYNGRLYPAQYEKAHFIYRPAPAGDFHFPGCFQNNYHTCDQNRSADFYDFNRCSSYPTLENSGCLPQANYEMISSIIQLSFNQLNDFV